MRLPESSYWGSGYSLRSAEKGQGGQSRRRLEGKGKQTKGDAPILAFGELFSRGSGRNGVLLREDVDELDVLRSHISTSV